MLVEGAVGIGFAGCNFTHTGGNALTFSKHVRASTVEDSEFVFVGQSPARVAQMIC